MATMNDRIQEQAIGWAMRVRDADFTDWDGFTRWLEADAMHNAAYEAVLLAEDDFVAMVTNDDSSFKPEDNISVLRQPANDEDSAPSGMSRRKMMSGLIAASLVAAVGAGVWTQMSRPYDIITGPGQHETVLLPDGSQIRINGDTKIELDYNKPRYARLDRGEALFTIVHDDGDPFIVDTGNARLVDAGTEFNVVMGDGMIDVAVSEGLVIYNPGRENVRLPAGKRLYRDGARGRVTMSDIAVEQVGSWRTGQLGFTSETLGEVAKVLDRNLAARITASKSVASRTFSGVIQIKDRNPDTIEPIAALLGVQALKQPGGWVLVGGDEI
ncbi:FecR domain-containing protein [Parasphingorhabdus sp. JC815]|uniref:FecR family protein n=1 Tax=Parasphingorhabdus sp. JC815 TaxID=3232140 RepID=UPI003457B18C